MGSRTNGRPTGHLRSVKTRRRAAKDHEKKKVVKVQKNHQQNREEIRKREFDRAIAKAVRKARAEFKKRGEAFPESAFRAGFTTRWKWELEILERIFGRMK